jgi:hypothetical protein
MYSAISGNRQKPTPEAKRADLLPVADGSTLQRNKRPALIQEKLTHGPRAVVSAHLQIYAEEVPEQLFGGSHKDWHRGRVRIPDGLDDGRADRSEMVRDWKPGAGEIKMTADHPFIQHLYSGDPPWKGEPGREEVTMVFQGETVFAMHSNCYIFSASLEYSPELALKMVEKFSADACVSINDPRSFMEIVTRHEALAGRPSALGNVDYIATNRFTEFERGDAFKKLEAFRWQREFRILWGGKQPEPAAPLLIDVPEIAPLLSRVH